MIQRREFFGLAAAVPAAALTNLNGIKSRQVSKWEIIYKSPHAKPNDLSMTSEGMCLGLACDSPAMLGSMMTYYRAWENRRFVRSLLREKQPEFADVLAWLASLANQLGLSLEDAAARYVSGCPRCGTTPCRCP